MGKKSRRIKSSTPTDNAATAAHPQQQQPPQQQYTSDGPSEEELNMIQTTSTSLQEKLNQLVQLAKSNDRAGFVSQFVPLDLSEEDQKEYLKELSTVGSSESETQWINLISEIEVIATGKGVERIDGDQITKATFCFIHPIHTSCDREVTFVCEGGVGGEWRAEG